ncbi:hypothetical protein SHLO109777_15940 [Shewanella loihica]|uniref:Uncharacterized protein n=1 Tax=Shewanella loihica (strain ATCC BAA-1088 / PV-4) TaxID=323850 RepID=A3QJ63_SHELP|nr:hypothetical protein [Shewanella loihica]ABO25511.1 hypothetical protein Shew_3645 [Shewanella loihica PV-4]
MNKYWLILVLAFGIENLGLCSVAEETHERVDEIVLDFLVDLAQIQVEEGEIISNKINSIYKSSHWVDVSQGDMRNVDISLVNAPFLILADLNGGKVIQSKIVDKYACVFVANKAVIGGFSLVYEDGWKFMAPSVYWEDQNLLKECSALKFELGVTATEFISLKE